MKINVNGFERDMTPEEEDDFNRDIANFVAPEIPPPPLPGISDRQFFQQLAVQGLITQDEALAAVKTGSIPTAMTTFIGQLPADQRFPAQMVLCGATTFERDNPLVAAFGAMQGMSAADVDRLWVAASQL